MNVSCFLENYVPTETKVYDIIKMELLKSDVEHLEQVLATLSSRKKLIELSKTLGSYNMFLPRRLYASPILKELKNLKYYIKAVKPSFHKRMNDANQRTAMPV